MSRTWSVKTSRHGYLKQFALATLLGVVPVPVCFLAAGAGDGSYTPLTLFYGPLPVVLSGAALLVGPLLYGCYGLLIG